MRRDALDRYGGVPKPLAPRQVWEFESPKSDDDNKAAKDLVCQPGREPFKVRTLRERVTSVTC